ncbi:MAG TPA: transaldolase [Candidatus Nanopelagicales bacterium]|nr:transaldolase [Candidatus Nanopelagicales bacterium]
MTPAVLTELSAAGVSIWLDDLDRTRLDGSRTDGSLTHLIAQRSVSGVTTNPTIFDRALGSGAIAYREQLAALAARGASVDEAITQITTDDVRAACDILRPVWEATGGRDGRVSIEVDPRLAHETQATVQQARDLWRIVDRPNALIKIPATRAGLPAITETLAHGISVNVTLIFSIDRYREVMTAHADGIKRAMESGLDPATIESVASFFVSRVDTAVDARLDALGSPDTAQLRGQAAIANARVAWQAYVDHCASDQWQQLHAGGARAQRPLWASTGVKDPAYESTRYVLDLVAPGCVNTMPEPTLHAVVDDGKFRGDTVSGLAPASEEVLTDLARFGIDIGAICADLEAAGVQAFIDSWEALRSTVEQSLASSSQ